MASLFSGAHWRIAQCRICLERDASSGIIPATAQLDVDGCYVAVARVLDEASVEIEAAGARLDGEERFVEQFVGECLLLTQGMFRAMYTERSPRALCRVADRLGARAVGLREHLWARLERVA
ncbi:MAG TPA: hypothetical protein QGG47_16800 [Acidobacteriota bacterium]|nr:hypothetical protein [Acidobacteriota bacterium]